MFGCSNTEIQKDVGDAQQHYMAKVQSLVDDNKMSPLLVGDRMGFPILEEDSMGKGHDFCSESGTDPCSGLLVG